MSLPIFKLYFDKNTPVNGLVYSSAENLPAGSFNITSSDKITLQVYFVDTFGASPTYYVPDETDTIVFAAKKRPSDDTVSLLNTDWTKYETYIESDVDFAPPLSGFWSNVSETQKTLYAEFEIRNSGNLKRATYGFPLILRRQVYGGESAPSSTTPYLDTAAARQIFVAYDSAQTIALSAKEQAATNIGLGKTNNVTFNALTLFSLFNIKASDTNSSSYWQFNPSGSFKYTQFTSEVDSFNPISFDLDNGLIYKADANTTIFTVNSAGNVSFTGNLNATDGTNTWFSVDTNGDSTLKNGITISTPNSTDRGQVVADYNGLRVNDIIGSSVFNTDAVNGTNTLWRTEISEGYLRVLDYTNSSNPGYLFHANILDNTVSVRDSFKLYKGSDGVEKFSVDNSGNVIGKGYFKFGSSGESGYGLLFRGTEPTSLSGFTLAYALSGSNNGLGLKTSSTNIGEIQLTNTAKRIYILPDVSGNVPLEDETVLTANVNKKVVVKSDKTIGATTELIEALNPLKWNFIIGSGSTAYTSGAGATTGATVHGMTVNGSTAAGYAVRQYDVNSFGAACLATVGSSGFITNWGKLVALYTRVCITSSTNDTGSVFQITLGRGTGEYTAKELTSKGVAFRWNPGSAAQLITYNTSENATNTSFTPTSAQYFELLLISNNGTVYCYVNGSLVASTTTQAPSGNSSNYGSTPQIGVFSTGAITNRVQALATSFKVYTE